MKKNVYICDAVRTAHGSFYGALKDYSSIELGSIVIKAILKNNPFLPEMIEGVFMGEVLTAGEGQNPARHAALGAGLPHSCQAETFNKVCASSLAALRHACNMIRVGDAYVMIAGGMESMSRTPYLVRRMVKRFGDETVSSLYIKSGGQAVHRTACDSMIHDGLTEPSVDGRPHMGVIADMCAAKYGISRGEQEEFALASFARANAAHDDGYFDAWTTEVNGVRKDEGLRPPDMEKCRKLQPAFSTGGTITAATSSQIADGASAILLGDEHVVGLMDARRLARVCDFAVCSQDPSWYTTAPVTAIETLLWNQSLKVSNIDLFEINEAFAVVPLYAMRALDIPHDKVNVWGGSIAIGHPLGASGTRIVGQLAHELRHFNKRYGIAVACNGGGEAVAVLLEAVE